MKFLKKLATFCMALTMCFGFGMALTACGGNGEASSSSSQTDNYTKYSFYVVKNNAPAVGYEIQLCKINEDGTLGSCLQPVAVGADGTVKVSVADTTVSYEIHVTKNNVPLSKDKYVTTGNIPANYNGATTLTVIVND